MKKILILIICIFTLTGCYNYIELSDLGIVSSLLIDYDDGYKIKLELYDDKKVQIIKGKGRTITEALENAESSTDKEIYYQHMNVVFITENTNIDDIIYYLLRNPNINNSFFLVYSEDTDIYEDDDENMGKMVKDHLTKVDNYSFFDVTNYYINKNRDLYLPILKKQKIDGIITLDGKNFKQELSAYEEGTIKILEGNTGSNIYVKCDNNYMVLRAEQVKLKMDVDKKIKIQLSVEADIKEFTCDYDTTKVEDIAKLQKFANKKLNKDINNIIDTLKEDKTDIIGFNTMINNKFHNLNKKFTDFDYEVSSDIHIYKKGLLLK